jgi:uncharacterized protein (DUF1697 family)
MTRYVAFLRGINVGGHIVVKATLEKVFTDLGFMNVSAYKQSGNIVFDASEQATCDLDAKIEAALKSAVGFDVPVFLRTLADLKDIVKLAPFRGQSESGSSFLVTFLNAPAKLPFEMPATIPKSTAQVIAAHGAEVFSVTHGGGEGALPNTFIEKALKCKATTRNIHIIEEIISKF